MGISSLGLFSAIFGPAAATGFNTAGIEHTADDVVTDAGQIANSAAADEHNGVFLKIMINAGDVGCDFLSIGEAHTGDFPESGVGFLGGHGFDHQTDAAFGGAGFEVFDLVDALQ